MFAGRVASGGALLALPSECEICRLAMRLGTHQRGGPGSEERLRRRDADGCGRDDRAARKSR